jgi:alkylation response protein AidB-like acyl-CoA dehydrogenase
MSIAITEEHGLLAEAAGRFLRAHCPVEVARADLDSQCETLPKFWGEMSALGWIGLHVSTADGGQGYGLSELAIVLEQIGRVAAPGPFLATVLATGAVARGGGPDLRREVLPGLITGSTVGAVAFPGTSALQGSLPDPEGTVVVTGTSRPVPSASLADWVVVAVQCPDAERLCVIAAGDCEVTELPSLDQTRRCASITVDSLPVPGTHQLTIDRRDLDELIGTLVAAECSGGASWCLETAAEYAKIREQFGRPIGQFQAIKHRLADMLISVEQTRAAAWDAALAVDQAGRGGPGDEASLSANVAAAVAPEAFMKVAKDCIQVLGGIGFTWDHEAHRYLRRATSIRQLSGPTGQWRRSVTDLATAGVRRHMGIDLPAEDDALRAAVREEVAGIAKRPRTEWRAGLVDAGFLVPHWPEPWGRAAGAAEQLVIDDELRRAGIRRPNLAVGAWAAPTIATHGTRDQQERWVGPTLLGQVTWCQLFSEPGAGSDLASLTTKAVRTAGGWRLTGQKVWTSLATEADWGICLARSDATRPKHLGITYFIVDMNSRGIDVRPLREMTGHAMFNEVFLSDVFVADDCVIGEVHGGWPLARTTLANERVAMGSGASFGGGVAALLSLVDDLGPADLDEATLDALGGLLSESHTLAALGQRSTYRALAGGVPGPEASVRKLLGAEHDQRTQEFGLGLLGGEGATTEGRAGQWTFGFLANRCLTIAGGTSEVQRNVIAERLLGLPRDPDPTG